MHVSVPGRTERSWPRRLQVLAAIAAIAATNLIAFGQIGRGGGGNTTAPTATRPAAAGGPPSPLPAPIDLPANRPTTGPASSTSEPASTLPATLPDAGTPVGPPPARPSDPSVWELHRRGGKVMWLLDACSILALAIILDRAYALRRGRVIPPGFLPGLRAVYRDPTADAGRAVDYCRGRESPMGRMVAAFARRRPHGLAAAERALEDAGATEALRLRANLRSLYAIGAVATLLGLLGTIAGMIRAFMETARAGDAADRVQLLSEGIYEAMVCTFGGLAVAILVTASYYYFVGRVEKLVTAINDELAAFGDAYAADSHADTGLAGNATAKPR